MRLQERRRLLRRHAAGLGEIPVAVIAPVGLLEMDHADRVAHPLEPRLHPGAIAAIDRLEQRVAPVDAELPRDRCGGDVGEHAAGLGDRPRPFAAERRRLDIELDDAVLARGDGEAEHAG